MNLIVCVENRMGMTFNGHRLSKDKKVIERILELAEGKRLWVSKYSAKLFEGFDCSRVEIKVCNNFLELADKGEDFCFVEDIEGVLNADKLYLFCWNRDYPYDKVLNLDTEKYKIGKVREFLGNSHPVITLKVYEKR